MHCKGADTHLCTRGGQRLMSDDFLYSGDFFMVPEKDFQVFIYLFTY